MQTSTSAGSIGALLGAQGYLAVPLRRIGAGLDTFTLGMNGAQGIFLLDTGASHSVINQRAAPKFKLTSRDLRGSEIAIGAGGDVALSSYRISGLTVQGQNFPFTDISATDLTHVVNAFSRDTGITLDGIIGQDVLVAFDGVIDTKNRTLYLRRP